MPIIPLNINDPSKNLYDQFVSQSFQRLLQVDSSGSVYDGTGSLYDVSSDSVFGLVVQPSHSFVVGDIVRPTGSANYYVLSQADIAENADVAGMITSIIDTSTFVLTTHGVVKTAVPNHPVGTNLFLSSEVPGVFSTESIGGRISKPLAVVTDPSRSMIFNNMRGILAVTTSLNSVTASYSLLGGSGFGPYTDGFFTSWVTGTPVADAMYEISQLFLDIAPAMAGVLTSTNLVLSGVSTFSGRMAGGLNATDWYIGYPAYTLLSSLTTQTSITLNTVGTGTANPTVFKAGKKSNLISSTLIGGVSSSKAHGTDPLLVASTIPLNNISGSSGSIRLNGVRVYNTIWAQASASILDTFTITGSMKYAISADNGVGMTNTYQIWYVGGTSDFPNQSISSASGSVSPITYNYLSGIQYYKTLNLQVNLTASNIYNPVYQDAYQASFASAYFSSLTAGNATPSTMDILSASFAGALLPNLNSARSTGSYTVTVYKPAKSNVSQTLLIGNKAINSYASAQATNNVNTQNEYFLDEAYRSPDGTSAHFSSGSALVDGNLQVQNGILICGRYGDYASFVSGSTAASSVYANYYRESVPGTSFRINGTFTFIRNSNAFAATNPISKWGSGGKLEMAMILSTDVSKVYDLGRQVGDNTGNIYGIVNGAPLTNNSTTFMVNWAYPVGINTGNILTDYVIIFIRYRNTTSSDYISSFNVVYN